MMSALKAIILHLRMQWALDWWTFVHITLPLVGVGLVVILVAWVWASIDLAKARVEMKKGRAQ
jgi:hypothetical protein